MVRIYGGTSGLDEEQKIRSDPVFSLFYRVFHSFFNRSFILLSGINLTTNQYGRVSHCLVQPERDIQQPNKKSLVPDAEVPAAEMVLREELAGRAETAYLFH